MSYHRKHRALSGDTAHGPRWYTAIGGVSTPLSRARVHRQMGPALGSLGDDPASASTLSQPTLTDPATAQWQANVMAQLQAGVQTLKTAELQKWLQIAATLSIPLAGAIWKVIFGKGRGISEAM